MPFQKSKNITQHPEDDALWYWFVLAHFAGHCLRWLHRKKCIKVLPSSGVLMASSTSEDSGQLSKPQSLF